MTIYFNEFDAYPAQWLRNLFPDATIDDRSIKDVRAAETANYLRCHFFAGIGGWELALQLAGFPADREVWTGSCPCQPFSVAGKRNGKEDERHLWPDFLSLISERLPPTIFGEQVASSDGRKWLAGVFADLEALGYAVAGADLCAAGVGAPHIRQRLYWVATRRIGDGTADTGSQGWDESGRHSTRHGVSIGGLSDDNGVAAGAVSMEGGCGLGAAEPKCASTAGGGNVDSGSSGLGHSGGERRQQECGSAIGRASDTDIIESGIGGGRLLQPSEDPAYLQWGNTAIICSDGKARRIEPSILPLAHGISNRVGRIRAYGNAIVPQIAAKFIRAFLEAEQET